MKIVNSKILLGIALLTFFLNGCMTYTSVQKARGKPYYNMDLLQVTPSKPKPAYYAIVPVTIPADIVTSPFQGILFGFQYMMGVGLGTTP